MPPITRRRLLATAALAGFTTGRLTADDNTDSASKPRRFTIDLNWGAIGVQANQLQAIDYATKYGFESVDADSGFLVSLDAAGREELAAAMQQSGLVWGAAALPVDFRRDDALFRQGLSALPEAAKALQAAGVTRVGTWLNPRHNELTYVANFRRHAARLRSCARILSDCGLRFGMEYVGPKTLWTAGRHSFIHTMIETKDLIAEIGEDNVGLVLDSWHWYTAHETVEDLRSLTNSDIVACDLNDAPVDRVIDEQIDNQRELPAATGVINLTGFLGALIELEYDGPVRAEPFNAKLNAMDNGDACRATSAAMKKAVAMLSKRQ